MNTSSAERPIVLLSDRAVVDDKVIAGAAALVPVAHQLPRKRSARAKSDVRIARASTAGCLVTHWRVPRPSITRSSDLDDASEDDWMSMLLQSRVLQQVPASTSSA